MSGEVDAADVLAKYAAVLDAPSTSVIRDARALPYSKDVIRAVLKHFLSKTNDPKGREVLKTAYSNLSDFQPLTEDEGRAVIAMAAVTDAPSSDDKLLELARIVSAYGDLYRAVMQRAFTEREALFLEVRAL